MIDWLPTLVGLMKLNLDGCPMGCLGQIGIGGVIRNHFGMVLRAFSKHAKIGSAIKVEILAL